ncbi:cinnamoyl-CoA reductase CAD2-like [Humulus lupulus]|uniref:cinnamoyl-CoA reductase CAD2-like n=1 Tax=Humulus lupulus TaxID=3486 RepID=UPI002B40D1D7|nr:cinnamoyl-CoA reductase CAD2-like [Humulus lupulus]
MSGVGKVVCVTGASGYIGSWLVKVLLQSGYIVKATVSNLSDSKKTDHLVALDGAEEKLHLFKANLMEEGSFDTAINGCDGVFHTASPAILSAIDPQAEIIEPAVKGTLNVLRSCAKAQSLKRVVITSSFASVLLNGKKLAPDVVVDETWFSDPVLCENLKLYYPLSKILAEEAAWKFAKENQIDLVTIHPALALGPLLPPVINNSVELIMNLVINGPQTFPISVCGFLDVRDVANAHVQAFEVASASGRYNLVGCVAHISDVLKILKDLYPALNIPEKCEVEAQPLMPKYQVSDVKAKSLGINYIPLEVSLGDTIESLKEKGFLNI